MSTRQFTLSGGQALSPLVQLVRLDSITRSLLPTRQARKFLSPFNEMQLSTRQLTLSGGQALSPLVRLVRLDYHYTESLANKTSHKISKSSNEMQMSTRQFTLSTRIMSTVLDSPLLKLIGYIIYKQGCRKRLK